VPPDGGFVESLADPHPQASESNVSDTMSRITGAARSRRPRTSVSNEIATKRLPLMMAGRGVRHASESLAASAPLRAVVAMVNVTAAAPFPGVVGF
jgi:hypothetical protein